MAISILTLLVALGTLATGVYWVHGGQLRVLVWNGLMVHVFLGIALVVLLLGHLLHRFRRSRAVDFDSRRTALQYAVLVGGGVLA